MSNVMLYNAVKENVRLGKIVRYVTVPGADPSFWTTNKIGATCDGANVTTISGGSAQAIGLNIASTWSNIPMMSGGVCGFAVCDAGATYRCGATCSWVVPAGITCAQFQIWGPGGNTGTNCCCGGAPFGPTGAYATVTMPVVAGCTYVLCAGCAVCCYGTQGPSGAPGGASFVTGYNLTNFCAMGGISCVTYWRSSLNANLGSSGCQFPASVDLISDSCGPESCGGWNFCWDAAADSAWVPFTYSCATLFKGSAVGGTVYGLAGMYPAFCIGPTALCDGTGFSTSAPIFGFANSSICTFTYGNNTAGGCLNSILYGGANAKMLIPGQGGYASIVNGGCNACGGDPGRMGMVCVCMK